MAKVQEIVEDLKNSWYFRFWAVLWFTFLILGFVALGILANRSVQTTTQKDSKIWYQSSASLYLPRFHFHTALPPWSGNEIITNISCTYQNNQLQVGPCKPFNGVTPSIYNCVAVYADQVEVFNTGQQREYHDFGVGCNITTTGTIDQVGTMIAFGIEGSNNYISFDDPHAPLWIFSTNLAIIELNRQLMKISGVMGTFWDRQIFYFNDAWTTGSYQVYVTIDGFGYFRFDTQNLYSGWRSTSDVGGFAYFLVVIHTAVMIILGICFANNSTFLKSNKSGSGPSARHGQHTASNAQEYAPLDG